MAKWQVGDKIANRFEIHKTLTGGMGVVYVCYDHREKIPLVLKTFHDIYLSSEVAQKLFEREALLWIQLERYPYIVRSHWVERLENRLFIILEYIPPDAQCRNTLTHYLTSLTLPDILKFSIQFCYGMEYAYSKGINAHRDIKPDNIMITADKTVKITDFGLAKAFQEIQLEQDSISVGDNSSLSIFQSKGKIICGTIPYMAPEQFDGYADERSDIYSFGITLYQMATGGKFPFIGRTCQEYEILHKDAKIPLISSELFPIIQKCLEKYPGKRHQNFTSINSNLQDLLLRKTGELISMPEQKQLDGWELRNKGVSLVSLGRHEEAIVCFDGALDINPQDSFTWNNKGAALTNLNRHLEALIHFDKATKVDPRDFEAWYNKGLCVYRLNHHDEAVTYFDKAIGINPEYAAAWRNKGGVLDKLGKYQEAIACYDKAIIIYQRDAFTWNCKGMTLCNLGQYEEAIACYDEAIEINPSFTDANMNKGICLSKAGKLYEALNSFDKAIEINPQDALIWLNKGITLSDFSKHEEAIFCFDKTIEINPAYTDAWFWKGLVLFDICKYEEAILCYDEAIKINPRQADAWNNKGFTLEKLGKYETAVSCYEKALEVNPRFNLAEKNKRACLHKLGK